MLNFNFGIMGKIVLLAVLSACLPMGAHAADLYWAVSFELTKIQPYGYTRQSSYGAAWNYPTAIDAKNQAYKECQKVARNPDNCEPPSETRNSQFEKDVCFIVYSPYPAFGYRVITRLKGDIERDVKEKIELIQCGE